MHQLTMSPPAPRGLIAVVCTRLTCSRYYTTRRTPIISRLAVKSALPVVAPVVELCYDGYYRKHLPPPQHDDGNLRRTSPHYSKGDTAFSRFIREKGTHSYHRQGCDRQSDRLSPASLFIGREEHMFQPILRAIVVCSRHPIDSKRESKGR